MEVRRSNSFRPSFSSSVISTRRTGIPSPRASEIRWSSAARAAAFLSPALISFWAFTSCFSTLSRSARHSSVSMISTSRTGSMEPSTWVMFPSSKQRTTSAMASVWRMWDRNLFPRPSPLEAPFTRPAMSTNFMPAGTIFLEWNMSARTFSRASGTSTTPTLGSMVQKG